MSSKVNKNGLILWRGTSPVDGAPICLIATGWAENSGNGKTGTMIQTWILREDISPKEAVNQGLDSSICGNCPHRSNPTTGKRTCYVRYAEAPLKIWQCFKRGGYEDFSRNPVQVLSRFAKKGVPVRWGSYGDPGMVPSYLIRLWSSACPNWTGYTHQTKEAWFDKEHLSHLMVSQDGSFDPAGPRSFRVISDLSQKAQGEILCPATPEGGMKTNCASCGLCKGGSLKAKSIAILAHGSGKKGFVPLVVS